MATAVADPRTLARRSFPGAGAALAGAALWAALLHHALQRTALNYGTETDFVGSYVPEAQRILAGAPPLVEYHPPLYALVVAAAFQLTGDWLRAGVLVSMSSAAGALALAFSAFRDTLGRPSGLGALAALLLSGTFLGYATQASGDVFFLLLFLAALQALAPGAEATPRRAFAAGVLAGLAGLARANGVAVLAFAAGLWRRGDPGSPRRLAAAAAGFAAPLLLWAAVATAWGAPVLPRHTAGNLALTYLAEGDRTSGDAMHTAAAGVDGALDVVARNPRRVLRIYASDLATNLQNVFHEDLLFFPFAELSLAGLGVLALAVRERRQWGLLVGGLAMFLVLNLKAWESRYYLYLVPLLGAGLGLGAQRLHAAMGAASRRQAATAALAAGAVFALLGWTRVARQQDGDLALDAQAAAALLPRQAAAVFARKPHLCFYAGLAGCDVFPDVEEPEALRAALAQAARGRAAETRLFVFYGFAERTMRPGLWRLGLREAGLPWLLRVGSGKENGKWMLYEVDRQALGRAEAAS